jgi:DNA-binding NtrC family response regulator
VPTYRPALTTQETEVTSTESTSKPAGNAARTRPSLRKFGLLYGSAPIMERLYDHIAKVAPTQAMVLIAGESGTGKELVANTIHQLSERREQPFIPVNCGAIPPNLIEAELFGHEKGSFTGAVREHAGYFECASGGTLFLDEITEMPFAMQAKLLRVLETGTVLRVGGTVEISVDVRLVVATNRDPWAAVKNGQFREDLMYRLAVFPLLVPALRERESDIECLSQHFLDALNDEAGTKKTFSRRSLDILRTYAWPGNVRELKNVVHRAFILSEKTLEIDEIISQSRPKKSFVRDGCVNFWVGTPLADAQREIILATLSHFEGNKERTAQTLGISLKTLYNRLNEYQ